MSTTRIEGVKAWAFLMGFMLAVFTIGAIFGALIGTLATQCGG